MPFSESTITRRKWLCGLGATATLFTLPSFALEGSSPTAKPTRFVYLTDIHSMVEWGCPDALKIVSLRINQLAPEFILVGGDLVDGGFRSTPEEMEPRWNLAMSFLHSFKAPTYVAAGNHDLIGAQNADLTLGKGDPRRSFREKLHVKELYQSYDIAGCHVIILDSVQPVAGDKWGYEGRIPEPQMDWLRRDLAKVNPATPIILVTHMPILSGFFQATGITDANGAPPPSLILVNGRDVLKLFANHNLRLVLQGHLHVDETIRWNGVTFITGGAVCGRKWAGDSYGTKEGFGRVDLTASHIDWDYRTYDWHASRPG